MSSNGWTEERRARQAEAIRRWKPWEKSTGPASDAGKSRVSRNAYKGGRRPRLREIQRGMREVLAALDEMQYETIYLALSR
jgi:hypothetical protein